MGLRIVSILAILSATVASAEIVTVNSTKAITLYDGGSEIDYLAAWSYTGGTLDQNKQNSYKTWISFNNSAILAPNVSDAELTLKQSYNGGLNVASPVSIDVYALTDSTGDAWNPNTVTWLDAPANDIASSKLLDPAKTTLVGSYTFTGAFPALDEVIHVPLNPAGVSFLNTDPLGLSTLILVAHDDSTSLTGFFAYPDSATLLATVPEPVVIGGILSTSLGLLLRKRVVPHPVKQ